MRPFPPVENEPAVAEEEPEVADEELVDAEPLPDVTSPSLEELAGDVAAAQARPEVHVEDAEVVDEEGPVTVKSVETVSAIDLIMGGAAEDAPGDSDESSHDAGDAASR
jgi:hypothetical protein